MANVAKMEKVFENLIEKYESSQRRLINTYAGNAGRDLHYERDVMKEDVQAFRKHFQDARDEV